MPPPSVGQHAGYDEARSCLVEAMRTADVPTIVGWADPLARQPTSSAALRPKRIDWTVLNRAARAQLRGARVDWGLGLSVHPGQWLDLHLRGMDLVPVWRPAAQVPTTIADGSEMEVGAALRGARVAIAARDLGMAWAALGAAAHAHHGATARAARPGASAGGAAEWVAPPARAREQVREEPQEGALAAAPDCSALPCAEQCSPSAAPRRLRWPGSWRLLATPRRRAPSGARTWRLSPALPGSLGWR